VTEPTNEQIQAVARVWYADDEGEPAPGDLKDARALLTSTDADLWAAIAAHIPLDALAQAGRLEVGMSQRPVLGSCEDPTHTHGGLVDDPTPQQHIVDWETVRRFVSAWEVQE
jgi:hypothetical protein